MTKLIDYAAVEKHFEKLGLVDLQIKSDMRVGYGYNDDGRNEQQGRHTRTMDVRCSGVFRSIRGTTSSGSL